MMPAETEPGIEKLRAEKTPPKFVHWIYALALTGIFAAALSVRLWFNFSAEHPNCAGCCDASEYVRNAAALKSMLGFPPEFWQKFFQSSVGVASAADADSVRTAMAGLKEIYQAGPIFPLFLNFSFAIVGGFFAENSLGAPILIQSILSAAACCLIADFTSKAWKRSVGYTAGVLAALYPGFIVNSGRLYTESFATFLVCLTLAITVRGFFSVEMPVVRGLASGILSACLQLTRSTMILLSVCLLPITFAQQKQAHWKKALAALLVGFACIILPWVCFQHAAFNKGGIVVDRVGNYNLFIGSNTQTQGWLTFPYPDGHGIEKKSLPGLLGESFKSSPSRFARLLLDKPARLFQLPWNDFRTPIGAFDALAQTFVHQFILLFALYGVTLAFFTGIGKDSPTRSQLYARFLLGGFAAVHLIYALFITVPRYALTAIPCIIAFSAAGIVAIVSLILSRSTTRLGNALLVIAGLLWAGQFNNLVQLLMDTGLIHDVFIALGIQVAVKLFLVVVFFLLVWTTYTETSGYRRMARIATALTAIVTVPLLLIPGRAAGRWFEWQKPLTDRAIAQSLNLPKNIGNRQAYVMIDANNFEAMANADVTVNGKSLTGPIIPGMALAQDYGELRHVDDGKVTWECENIFNYMTRPADISNAQLRQWFFIPVPKELTRNHAGQALQVAIKQKANSQAGGVIFGTYAHGKHLILPSVSTYSWEKAFYGVENSGGLTDPRLDDSLDLSPTSVSKVSATSPTAASKHPATNSKSAAAAKSKAAPRSTTAAAKSTAAARSTVAAKSTAAKSSGAAKSTVSAKSGTAAKSKAAPPKIKAAPPTKKPHKSSTSAAPVQPSASTDNSGGESQVADTAYAPINPSMIANIRLVVAPPGFDDNVDILKFITPKLADLTNQHLVQQAPIFTMPEFKATDLWIIRTTGDIKSESQTARPTMTVKALCGAASTGKETSYESPWTPTFFETGSDWKHFEVDTPIAPGSLPGGIRQLIPSFVFDAPQWKTSRPAPSDRVQLRNVRIEIVRLSVNPLSRGYLLQ